MKFAGVKEDFRRASLGSRGGKEISVVSKSDFSQISTIGTECSSRRKMLQQAMHRRINSQLEQSLVGADSPQIQRRASIEIDQKRSTSNLRSRISSTKTVQDTKREGSQERSWKVKSSTILNKGNQVQRRSTSTIRRSESTMTLSQSSGDISRKILTDLINTIEASVKQGTPIGQSLLAKVAKLEQASASTSNMSRPTISSYQLERLFRNPSPELKYVIDTINKGNHIDRPDWFQRQLFDKIRRTNSLNTSSFVLKDIYRLLLVKIASQISSAGVRPQKKKRLTGSSTVSSRYGTPRPTRVGSRMNLHSRKSSVGDVQPQYQIKVSQYEERPLEKQPQELKFEEIVQHKTHAYQGKFGILTLFRVVCDDMVNNSFSPEPQISEQTTDFTDTPTQEYNVNIASLMQKYQFPQKSHEDNSDFEQTHLQILMEKKRLQQLLNKCKQNFN